MDTQYSAQLTIPMPMTDNHRLMPFGNRLVKSSAYRIYEEKMKVFKIVHHKLLSEITEAMNNCNVRVDTKICFNHNRVFTKKNSIKKIDHVNRLKICFDIISKLIEIDDSRFVEGFHSKCFCNNNKPEHVIISISRAKDIEGPL